MRYYGFHVDEIISPEAPFLDMQIDPKLAWALNHLDQFPVDINTADLEILKRIPGVGIQSAKKIWEARKFRKLNWEHLQKFNIATNRARYFVQCKNNEAIQKDYSSLQIRNFILSSSQSKYAINHSPQLTIF